MGQTDRLVHRSYAHENIAFNTVTQKIYAITVSSAINPLANRVVQELVLKPGNPLASIVSKSISFWFDA